MYNISTQQKKNGYVHVNSPQMIWYGRVIVMKHFACSVFYPPRWLNLPEVWRSHSNQDAESDCCSVWLGEKNESHCSSCECVFMFVCARRCVFVSVCAFTLIHTTVCMRAHVCRWHFRRDEFQMMENGSATVFRIIFLGTGHIFCFESYSTINMKLTWMWNFRQTFHEYTKSVSLSWPMKQLQAVYLHVITD